MSFTRREPNRVFPAFRFLWFEKVPTFRRNLALVSVLYIGERLNMISHDEESKQAETKQNQRKTKI